MADETILAILLKHEGSTYTDDSDDAGGPTRFGVTLATLSAWRGHSCTADDVRNLIRTEAEDIYRAQYIRPFDEVPEPLRINAIDFGVNAGVRRAASLLQQMAGVTVDGVIGRETLTALSLRTSAEWNTLYVGMRLAFYENLIVAKPSQVRFRRGWRVRALSFLTDVTPSRAGVPIPHVGKAVA